MASRFDSTTTLNDSSEQWRTRKNERPLRPGTNVDLDEARRHLGGRESRQDRTANASHRRCGIAPRLSGKREARRRGTNPAAGHCRRPSPRIVFRLVHLAALAKLTGSHSPRTSSALIEARKAVRFKANSRYPQPTLAQAEASMRHVPSRTPGETVPRIVLL